MKRNPISRLILILGSLFLIPGAPFSAFSQCPTNEADLADGGTFSGDCSINVGGRIDITGSIIWTSGRLTINDSGGGGDGDMDIQSGGSFLVQDGATLDLDDGDITVLSGADLTIAAGGSVEVMDNGREVYVDGGTLTVNGTLEVRRDLEAYNSASVTFGNGAIVTTGDDFDISGGATITVQSGATLNLDDDLDITGNSSLTIESGASVTLGDEMFIEDSNVIVSGTLTSTGPDDINVDGSSNVTFNEGANVTFNDLEAGTRDGSATVTINGGTVTIQGEVDFNNGTDGDAIIINGGLLDIGNDLEIGSTDGTITVNSGGTLNTPSIDGVAITDPNDLPNNIVIAGGDVNVNGAVLPVELISFSGSYSNSSIILEWETASEQNNERFEVQKSVDGGNFITISQIIGKGTTNQLSRYQFIDKTPLTGKYYYRLLQFDFNGEMKKLPTITVVTEKRESPSSVKIYPNPVTENKLTIQLGGGIINHPWTLRIVDIEGKILLKRKASTGSSVILLGNLRSSLKPGLYFLHIQGKEHHFAKKIYVK
jgi:hypothetical protein